MSASNASVLLLAMNFVLTFSKYSADPLSWLSHESLYLFSCELQFVNDVEQGHNNYMSILPPLIELPQTEWFQISIDYIILLLFRFCEARC